MECYINPKVFRKKFEDLTSGKITLFSPTQAEYTNITDELANYYLVAANSICGGVNIEYVNESIANTQLLLIAVRTDSKGNRQLFGFATVLYSQLYNFVKIDVICSSTELLGGGTLILNGVKEIATSLGATRIKLESVKNNATVKFYLKNGFTFSIQDDDDCTITTDFNDEKRFGSRAAYEIHGDKLCEMSLHHDP